MIDQKTRLVWATHGRPFSLYSRVIVWQQIIAREGVMELIDWLLQLIRPFTSVAESHLYIVVLTCIASLLIGLRAPRVPWLILLLALVFCLSAYQLHQGGASWNETWQIIWPIVIVPCLFGIGMTWARHMLE